MTMIYKCLFIYTMVFDTSSSYMILMLLIVHTSACLSLAYIPYFARPICNRTLYAAMVFPGCFPLWTVSALLDLSALVIRSIS
jgi:hypothetical protein